MFGFRRAFFLLMYKAFGWKTEGQLPDIQKAVIIFAPHTSNWDFFVALGARYILRVKSEWLGKKSLFAAPVLGAFMRWIGGHPVDRAKHANLVDQVVEMYNVRDQFMLTLAPEGTRSYQPKWKTGFYHIAVQANVPILMVSADYKRRVFEMKEPFWPTGDLERDMDEILAYYRTVKGKNPELGVR